MLRARETYSHLPCRLATTHLPCQAISTGSSVMRVALELDQPIGKLVRVAFAARKMLGEHLADLRDGFGQTVAGPAGFDRGDERGHRLAPHLGAYLRMDRLVG